jgi:hypothetical protein
MFRISIKIIGTVLAAAIVVVPVASAGGPRTPAEGSSPALRDYRQGVGFSFKAPSYWNAAPSYWSTARGAAPITVRGGMNRSLGVPPQYLGTHHAAVSTAKVDPLAVGYLIGQGLSPSQVTSWTVGACSHQIKAASCYAMLEPASTSSTQVTGSTGFQWGDAVIGAGFTLGIVLLLGGAGAGLFISRQNRHPGGARVNQVRVEV